MLVGDLPRSGIGRAVEMELAASTDSLRASVEASNKLLLDSLREDEWSDQLYEITLKDARLGRMSYPVEAKHADLKNTLLHPRFGVSQLKEDGTYKVRAVDNFSWSARVARDKKKRGIDGSVNAFTVAFEKLTHDSLDVLVAALCEFHSLSDEVPGLVKINVDSAFRRVPIRPGDRWVCGIAFVAKGKVRYSFLVGLAR